MSSVMISMGMGDRVLWKSNERYPRPLLLEEMERVPVSEVPERFEELLRRIEEERVGFVLTQDGKDKYFLIPFSSKICSNRGRCRFGKLTAVRPTEL